MLASLARSKALWLALALAFGIAQGALAANLSKVTVGMHEGQVRELLGQPTSQVSYPSWKVYMPWNWGGGGSRVEYKYKGQGRVVFETKAWTGQLRVVKVVPDPSEDGY